ncbi:MAG: TIM barrel protein [Pseudomonadota bacterium]
MPRFSANLGFLWTELDLPGAVRAAAKAGFNAVECHWPYDTDPMAIRAALDETRLPMLGLNTRRGQVAAGENGLAALPGREGEARAAIDEAFEYAEAVDANAVHVMAGIAEGVNAQATFLSNLQYASDHAGHRTVLIEPLNAFDAPGYFLNTTQQACSIIEEMAEPNLKLMFDCYHVARTEGDVIRRLEACFDHIGHIQFASVPDRRAPDQGTLDYRKVFQVIDGLGWARPLGAEYRPDEATEASLTWMKTLQ